MASRLFSAGESAVSVSGPQPVLWPPRAGTELETPPGRIARLIPTPACEALFDSSFHVARCFSANPNFELIGPIPCRPRHDFLIPHSTFAARRPSIRFTFTTDRSFCSWRLGLVRALGPGSHQTPAAVNDCAGVCASLTFFSTSARYSLRPK